jgi:hypothetical protein
MGEDINGIRLKSRFMFDDNINRWLLEELENLRKVASAVAEGGNRALAVADNHDIEMARLDVHAATIRRLRPLTVDFREELTRD